MAKPQKTDDKFSSTPLRAGSTPGPRRNEPNEVSGTKTVTVLKPETRQRRGASGPRTAIGKQRSSLNAQKYGISSRGLLVGDESPREFKLLLMGLHGDLQPEGALETVLVENLATIIWRKKRVLRAESAEIEEAVQLSGMDAQMDQRAEAWDCERSGEKTGGMLKNIKNMFVLRSALEILKIFRYSFEHIGFPEDPWLLRKLYGLDYNEGVPWGAYKFYQTVRDSVADHQKKDNNDIEYVNAAKQTILHMLDREIEHLEKLKKTGELIESQRDAYRRDAALVPHPPISERLLRYEAHFESRVRQNTFST
jgi:hypothetical protein